MTKALAAAALAALLVTSSAATHGAREGGTFRIGLDSDPQIDPALAPAILPGGPACGTLLAGLRLRPDLAETAPRVSRGGKTYTFTIRKNARFSSGAAVTARAFTRALERIREPALRSGLAPQFEDIRATATGRTLTLRLTRPQPLLPALTTELCAVPPNLPVDPEGAGAPLPSAGPYYVAEYVRGERLRLERNRFYNGTRARHVDRFMVVLNADQGSLVDDIASGRYDWGGVNQSTGSDRAAELAQRYGVNRGQYWVKPGNGLRLFHLNTSGPLFRNNPKLRQAVNLAIDRRALTRELGVHAGRATDQYLLHLTPGFRDARIYPWKPPDLRRARALAKDNRRSGKAVLYTPDRTVPVATSQIVQENLKEIGLEVEIKKLPPPVAFDRMTIAGEPFDIGYIGYFGVQVRDPVLLNFLFDGRTIGAVGTGNRSHLNSPNVNRLLDEASRLTGPARYRAYAELDIRLSRDIAPAIPWAVLNETRFVSPRVGCVTFNPVFDLTGICLK